MISLKSFLPVLSKHTDLSVTALYERQRALVRLGLYPAPTQSGRNSGGAMATPGNVGIMLLSVLVTDRLSEIDERMFDYLALKPNPYWDAGRANPQCCTITGQPYLYRALQVLLRPDYTAMAEIAVDRKQRLVHVTDPDPEGLGFCTFGMVEGPRPIEHIVRYNDVFDLALDLDLCSDPDPTVRENSVFAGMEFD